MTHAAPLPFCAGPHDIRARLAQAFEGLRAARAAEDACGVISWQAQQVLVSDPCSASRLRHQEAVQALLEASQAVVLWQDARLRLERSLARAGSTRAGPR